jgi:Flp pilus assembly pilin Flp
MKRAAIFAKQVLREHDHETDLTELEETNMKRFFLDETGLELSEYAVAAALVAIAVVGAITALGTAIGDKITSLGSTISK